MVFPEKKTAKSRLIKVRSSKRALTFLEQTNFILNCYATSTLHIKIPPSSLTLILKTRRARHRAEKKR